MAFDTFDEGINPGGMRSKNEIKTLICYLYNSVKENIDKGIVIQAILKQDLPIILKQVPPLTTLLQTVTLCLPMMNTKHMRSRKTVLKLQNSLTAFLRTLSKKRHTLVRLSSLP